MDDFAFIKSLHSESNDHVPALYQINTGIARPGFPAAGAWVTYGLGSENQNLPGYVVLGNNQGVKGGPLNWRAGFLPSTYQGTLFRPEGNPILNLKRPGDVTRDDQRRQLDLLAQINAEHLEAHPGEADLLGRIQSFELAYRMQAEAAPLDRPLAGIGGDSEAVRARIGRKRGRLGRSACWRADWSSAACASCRSTATASGTPTPISQAITRAIAWRPTCRSTACSPT